MITRLNNWLAKRMPWNEFGQRWSIWRYFDIMDRNDPTQVYLRRLRVIQTPWFGFYVHWVFLPDNDRDLHDHPWPFWSFVARGGYAERVCSSLTGFLCDPIRTCFQHNKHRRFSLHRMPLGSAHKITHVEPGTITWLLIGRRQRDWGFWTDEVGCRGGSTRPRARGLTRLCHEHDRWPQTEASVWSC